MEHLLPNSFSQVIAGVLILCASIGLLASFKAAIRPHSLRLFSLSLISALALFAHNGWVYFASVFIIAAVIVETEFLQNLAAIIRGDKHYFDYQKVISGQIPLAGIQNESERKPLEFKILNTLWTKQVNKFPDFSGVWTFRINASAPDFMKFREAGNKLLGEGLIGETDQGQFHLTKSGFDYCKVHYKEFPPDQWWPEEQINPAQLKRVVG